MSDYRLYSEDSVNRMLDYVQAVKDVAEFLNVEEHRLGNYTVDVADVRQVLARHGL